MPPERIQKILAKAGIASRREAEKIMTERRVTVNGKVVDRLGSKADPLVDHIKLNGTRINFFEPQTVLLMNKPRGYLSTVKDPKGRPTVMDLLKKVRWRVYPIGRLDFDAEGLLLLTNDGDLAYRLSHPTFSIPRTYFVKIRGVLDEKRLTRLKKGILIEGRRTQAVSCRILRQKEKNSWIEITVTEGRNHLVKKMFSAIGSFVLKLKRVQFGSIHLGDLPSGQWRSLTHEEINRLKAQGSNPKV